VGNFQYIDIKDLIAPVLQCRCTALWEIFVLKIAPTKALQWNEHSEWNKYK